MEHVEQKQIIKNLWGMTKFYCGHGHEVPVEMTYKDGPTSMFYSCPRYYVDKTNRPGDRACANRLSFDDAEAIILRLSDVILEHEQKGEEFDLTNYRMNYKQVQVKVLKYSPQEMQLEILNRRALR